ncbi:MAG: hypothetical protein Q4F51_02440 [Sarcina sp.]|nr:hypothetical protein [Sarcina sp.]
MEEQIFRKKSLDRLSSPEQLNDYLHVTSPGIWIVLGAVIFLLISIFVWSSFTTIESYAAGDAVAENGVLMITFDDPQTAANVETGMAVSVGDLHTPVLTLGKNADGSVFATANADLPNGTYRVKVGYRQTQVIKMLFN